MLSFRTKKYSQEPACTFNCHNHHLYLHPFPLFLSPKSRSSVCLHKGFEGNSSNLLKTYVGGWGRGGNGAKYAAN